jgi:hypothetical protein
MGSPPSLLVSPRLCPHARRPGGRRARRGAISGAARARPDRDPGVPARAAPGRGAARPRHRPGELADGPRRRRRPAKRRCGSGRRLSDLAPRDAAGRPRAGEPQTRELLLRVPAAGEPRVVASARLIFRRSLPLARAASHTFHRKAARSRPEAESEGPGPIKEPLSLPVIPLPARGR